MSVRTGSESDQQRAAMEILRRHYAGMDLMDFVPTVTPDFDPPRHLAPLIELFERAFTEEGVRGVTSVPPQHAKSQTLFHLIVKALLRDPTKRHLYATYSIDWAKTQSLNAARIAHAAHLDLEREALGEWTTPEGGGVAWTGRGGAIAGRPVDGIAVIDDPLKNWEEALSPTIRSKAMHFIGEVLQRLHPGASVIINATRWHENDPSGRMIERGWPHVNLPAILDDGEPLWPERRPLWFLERQKADLDPADWHAIYMGNPRPREGAVLTHLPRYDELPPRSMPFTEAVGFDGAYTASDRADWTVAVRGRLYSFPDAREDALYVTDMVRIREAPERVIAHLHAAGVRAVTWRLGTTEVGMAHYMRQQGIKVREVKAKGDKLVANQAMLTDVRRKRILFPKSEDAPWMSDVEAELLTFTGTPADRHDDIVDALGALHHELVLYRGPDVDALRAASGIAE